MNRKPSLTIFANVPRLPASSALDEDINRVDSNNSNSNKHTGHQPPCKLCSHQIDPQMKKFGRVTFPTSSSSSSLSSRSSCNNSEQSQQQQQQSEDVQQQQQQQQKHQQESSHNLRHSLIVCQNRGEVYTLFDANINRTLDRGDVICVDCIDRLLSNNHLMSRVKFQDMCCECGRNVRELAVETDEERQQRIQQYSTSTSTSTSTTATTKASASTSAQSQDGGEQRGIKDENQQQPQQPPQPISQVIKSWAHIEGRDGTFSYGLSGTFKFVDDSYNNDSNNNKHVESNWQPGSVMCRFCLEQHSYVPYTCIECGHCHERYQGCMRTTDVENGFGCAANVDTFGINCGYCSKFDDHVLRFTAPDGNNAIEEHGLLLGRQICDRCIDRLIDEGVVTGRCDENR